MCTDLTATTLCYSNITINLRKEKNVQGTNTSYENMTQQKAGTMMITSAKVTMSSGNGRE